MMRFSKTLPGVPLCTFPARGSPGPQIDPPVRSEGSDELARPRVDLLEEAVDREDQPPVGSIGALPVVEAPVGRCIRQGPRPARLPRGRVERHDRVVLADDVHHVVHHQRPEREPAAGARAPVATRPVAAVRRSRRRSGAAPSTASSPATRRSPARWRTVRPARPGQLNPSKPSVAATRPPTANRHTHGRAVVRIGSLLQPGHTIYR